MKEMLGLVCFLEKGALEIYHLFEFLQFMYKNKTKKSTW